MKNAVQLWQRSLSGSKFHRPGYCMTHMSMLWAAKSVGHNFGSKFLILLLILRNYFLRKNISKNNKLPAKRFCLLKYNTNRFKESRCPYLMILSNISKAPGFVVFKRSLPWGLNLRPCVHWVSILFALRNENTCTIIIKNLEIGHRQFSTGIADKIACFYKGEILDYWMK